MLEHYGYNKGGVYRIEVVAHQDVLTMPIAYKGQLLGPVVLKPGAFWRLLYSTKDTQHFVEAPADRAKSMVLKFSAPKDSINSLARIYDLESQRFIVRITDMNNTVKIAGRPGEGCAITNELRDNGGNKRDKNHYTMAIRLTRGEAVPILFT